MEPFAVASGSLAERCPLANAIGSVSTVTLCDRHSQIELISNELKQLRPVPSGVCGAHAELILNIVLAHLRISTRAGDQIYLDAAPAEQLDASPGADVVRRTENEGRHRRAKLFIFKNRFD